MYCRDPDGNHLETQVDNLENAEDATAMMGSAEFTENSVGTDFDPEELCAAVERGEDDATLKVRRETGLRGPEDIPTVLEMINTASVGA